MPNQQGVAAAFRGNFFLLYMSAVGALIFNAFPVVLAVLAERFSLDDAAIGFSASSYMIGAALAAAIAPTLMARLPLRALLGCAGAAATLGIAVMTAWPAPWALYLGLAVIGMGAASMFAFGTTLLAMTGDARRIFGVKIFIELLAAAIFALFLATFFDRKHSYPGMIILLIAVFASAAIWGARNGGGGLLFERLRLSSRPFAEIFRYPGAVIGFLCLLVQFGVFSGVWSYLQPLGVMHGVGEETLSILLSLSIIGGLFGAGGAILLGCEEWRSTSFVLGGVLTVSSLALLWIGGAAEYLIGAFVFGAMIQFVTAVQMGVVAVLDRSVR